MTAKYYIYRNLHRNLFSIRLRGRVTDRGDEFIAENVIFKVNESGRQRVLKEKKKNVHAFCVSDKYYPHKTSVDRYRTITYNPYVASYFTCDGKRIDSASKIYFRSGKCYLIE